MKKLAYIAATMGGALFVFGNCGWFGLGGDKAFIVTAILNELIFS